MKLPSGRLPLEVYFFRDSAAKVYFCDDCERKKIQQMVCEPIARQFYMKSAYIAVNSC